LFTNIFSPHALGDKSLQH